MPQTVIRPIRYPGEQIVEDDDLEAVDAADEDQDRRELVDELEQIGAAEREAAGDTDLVRLA